MNNRLKRRIIKAQCDELTECKIYKKLSLSSKGSNKRIFEKISQEEMNHHNLLKKITKQDIKPSEFKIWFYCTLAKFMGTNFSIHLMEKGEKISEKTYTELMKHHPATIKKLIQEEEHHEKKVLKLVDKMELKYSGSVVLGLNDALVELTGALSGLTLALRDTRIIAIVGLLVGVAASLSMAASEYLQKKEENGSNPLKSSFFTGIAYFIAVIILIIPFFVVETAIFALFFTIVLALLLIFAFTFYTSIARNTSMKKKFFQMAGISLGVALFNFIIGYFVRIYFNL